MIAGVCGGVAEFFNVDPTIVRLLWFLSIFFGGAGILLYVVAMIIIPTNPSGEVGRVVNSSPGYFWGFLLIGLGALLLLHNFDLVPPLFWWDFSWKMAVALVLIVIGAILVLTYIRERSAPPAAAAGKGATERRTDRRKLYRSLHERKIFGVCGGMGEYFDIDPSIIRLLFVFITLYSFGFGILAYLLLAIVTPEERLALPAMESSLGQAGTSAV